MCEQSDYVSVYICRVKKNVRGAKRRGRPTPMPKEKKMTILAHRLCSAARYNHRRKQKRLVKIIYTEGVGGLIGGSTREIIIKRRLSGMRNRLDDLNENVVQKRPATRDASRASHFYFAREGKPLKEVAMLGERMCNLHFDTTG